MTKNEKKTENKSNKNWLQGLLIVLLVMAAFASGSMWRELSTLKSGKKEEIKQEEVKKEEVKKEDIEVLSDKQWQKVIKDKTLFKGDKNAKITIVEFTDYQCPFCSRYVIDTLSKITKDYILTGKVQYILKDLPLPFHKHSQATAQVARCANDQGKYWEMHDKLFELQSEWSESEGVALFKGYAGELGLDQVEFDVCLDDHKYKQVVADDLVLADEVGAKGTPTFFINGKKLVGAQPFAKFKEAIEAELK